MIEDMKIWREGDYVKFNYWAIFDHNTQESDCLYGEVDATSFSQAMKDLQYEKRVSVLGNKGRIEITKTGSEYELNFSGVGTISSIGFGKVQSIDTLVKCCVDKK